MRTRQVIWLALLLSAWPLHLRAAGARTLTFEDRVRAQAAIMRVDYAHQIAATRPFEEVVPRAVLESKVRTYLEESAALETYWKTPITVEAIGRELERMERNSRLPDRLRELETALGDDRVIILECLARPALADRLARSFFASDQRLHATGRREAEDLRARLGRGALRVDAEHPRRSVADFAKADPGKAEAAMPGGRQARPAKRAIGASMRARLGIPETLGTIGPVTETRDAFRISVVLRESADDLTVAIYEVPKRTWDDWWAEAAPALEAVAVTQVATREAPAPAFEARHGSAVVTTPVCQPRDIWNNGILGDMPDVRSGHSAVWTGSEMIVWGGGWGYILSDAGGKYDPLTDAWSQTSTRGAPTPRAQHTAVWTGSRMIVWGGVDEENYYGLGTGAQYDPATDTWSPVSSLDAPNPRTGEAAVWTGSEMIIWGGIAAGTTLASGGRYNPATDTWSPTSAAGAPAPRWEHTAIWTGSRMIVWGGNGGYYPSPPDPQNTGALYDPVTDTWSPTSTAGAPIGRSQHSAVWTGSKMIVWGGAGVAGITDTGGRYDPSTDTWAPTSRGPMPQYRHAAVWTGTQMIVWGGYFVSYGVPRGARYDPATDTWRSVSELNAPQTGFPPEPTVVWTGSLMLVWGGGTNEGGRYDPATDSWTPTSTGAAPPGPLGHTAVWTGSKMIVWGGMGDVWIGLNSGGLYDPAADTWTPTTTVNAPAGRHDHSAVWTGTEMIVWGGASGPEYEARTTGGRYDPIADRWSPISPPIGQYGRVYPAAVWTGKEMIVWGGYSSYAGFISTGLRYDPSTDTWTLASSINSPEGRYGHSLVWTGKEMIVWGGYGSSGGDLDTGGRYDPSTDTWTQTSTVDAPVAREGHTATWTGREMVVWGGRELGYQRVNSGGRYDPLADRWVPTSTTGAPQGGWTNTAVWTGVRLIVWVGDQTLTSGGLYDPQSDAWSPMSFVDAPARREYQTAVWTGREMIVWGGAGDDSITSLVSGGRYFPDARFDPPVVDAGEDFAQECGSPDGTSVALHATASGCGPLTYTWTGPFAEGGGQVQGADALVTLPLGGSDIVLRVDDTHGQSATDGVTVAVRDTTPPTLSVAADPSVLWPPNHQMIPVSLGWQVHDRCDANPRVALVSVTSSEPDDAPGTSDGATTGDITGAGMGNADATLDLRAERDGDGPGRVYQIAYDAVDASGNTTPALAVVTVPHDLGRGPETLLMRLEPDATSGMVRLVWPEIPGATGYDVIAGDLSQTRVENGTLSLGTVRVLARGTTATSIVEGASGAIPATGSAIFYLIQSRTAGGGSGYGSESAPWPRVPAACDGGCP